MALLSQLFSGNAKLDAAAVNDSAHIFQGAKGPHVAMIQQALNNIDGASLDPDGAFGPGTAAAVRAFKTKRKIVNFQGKIDDIVGKKTIVALDEELLGTVKGGVRGAGSAVTIVPFAKDSMFLIRTFDKREPTAEKNDLDTDFPPNPKLKLLEEAAILRHRITPPFGLHLLMQIELTSLAEALGLEMFTKFKENLVRAAEIPFLPGSRLADKVASLAVFKNAEAAVRAEFDAAIKKQAAAGTIDVNLLEANTDTKGKFGRPQKTNPNGIKTSMDLAIPLTERELQAVIGGSFQGGHVALVEFSANEATRTYTATLGFTLIDHFGVDNSDVLGPPPHGSDGQQAFWVLQHMHGPGNNPYVTTVIIMRTVTGSF